MSDIEAALLTVPEVAQKTRVSNRKAWQWVYGNELPIVRLGRHVRVRPADLEAFIERHREAVPA